MRRPRFLPFIFASLAGSAILCLSVPSLATSTQPEKPSCPLSFAPSSGMRVPANAPAIAVASVNASNLRFRGVVPFEDRTFTLVADITSPETSLLVPSKPLEAGGRYEVSLFFDCETEKTQASTVSFDASQVVALPTQIGSLVAGEPSYAQAHVVLTPTPEMAAFLPVARFEIRALGAPWTAIAYGAADIEDGKVPFRISNLGGAALESRFCEPGEEGIKRFDVELRAHVAGATADPDPATLTGVPIDCTRPAYAVEAADHGPEGAPSASRGGGCTSAPSDPGAAPAAALLSLVLASLAALMRRRRSTPPPRAT